jgi:hypothetical protein
VRLPIWTLDQAELFQCKILDAKRLYEQVLIGKLSLLNIFMSSLIWLYWTSPYRKLLNEDKKKIQNILLTKRARITGWSLPTVADIKALLGSMLNMCLYPMCDITDYFSHGEKSACFRTDIVN